MTRCLAVMAFVLVACSTSAPVGAVSSPSRSPSASRSPASPSATASPTPFSDLPVTAVDFSCRLPVVAFQGDPGPGITLQGAFIAFPTAQLAEDPAGTMRSREAEGDYATAAAPVLYGNGFVPFFDRPQSRWVPAPANQSLADGSGYAYVTWDRQTAVATVHVVDLPTARARSFELSSPFDPVIADYGPAGVYIIGGSALGGPGTGVWLLNPATGAMRALMQIAQVWTVRNGYAWVARFDPRDKTVWPQSELAPANSLVRIDLRTGAQTEWFYRAGSYPWMIGLDSSDAPIVSLPSGAGREIRLIDRQGGQGVQVYGGDIPGLDYVQGDRDRLWFGNARGIYLYRPGHAFQKVFAYGADPATANRIEAAGFCL